MADDIETQTQQVTSETPATKPAKNPKRVAAGKLVAERTRQALEAQKNAAAEAAAQKDTPAHVAAQPQPTDGTTAEAAASSKAATCNATSISTTQWLAIGSFVVSLIGLYCKREEVKSAFSLLNSEAKKSPRATGATPETKAKRKKGIRSMD